MMDLSHKGEHEQGLIGSIGRRHPVAARILRRWRVLTGGASVGDDQRRTLVACSGGVDSVALGVVLSLVRVKPVIAHVTHDIRSSTETQRDADHVQAFAEQLGCGFVHRSVRVADVAGNLERNARHARYHSLEEMAIETGCRFIATGHQAEDQAETVLMNLMRGAGVRGLGGIGELRRLDACTLVRPMLTVRRAQIEELCAQAGVGYVHDGTNDDQSFTRNRVRHTLIPMLESVREDAIDRVVESAANCRDAADLVSGLVDDEYERWERVVDGIECTRIHARGLTRPVFDGVIRRVVIELNRGTGLDRVARRGVLSVIRAVRSASTERSVHRVGPICVDVSVHTVQITVAVETGERDE